MKKSKITGRDIKVFFLGFLSFFLLSAIYSWKDNVAAFKEGFEAGINPSGADTAEAEKTETTAFGDQN